MHRRLRETVHRIKAFFLGPAHHPLRQNNARKYFRLAENRDGSRSTCFRGQLPKLNFAEVSPPWLHSRKENDSTEDFRKGKRDYSGAPVIYSTFRDANSIA